MVGFNFNTNTPFGEYCTLPITFQKLDSHITRISIDTSIINDYFNFEDNTSEIKVELFIQYHQLNYQEIHKTESFSLTDQYIMINNREFHPSSILYLDNDL